MGILYFLERTIAAQFLVPKAKDPNRKTLAVHGAVEGGAFDHRLWDAVLKAHVKEGTAIGDIKDVSTVDYSGVAKDSRFETYIQQLASADVDSLSPKEQLVLWMNAYNALCIGLIVTCEREKGSGTVASINDLDTKKTKVWDLPAGNVGGSSMSLNDIEHKVLRKQWAEPAVHACIVCASASCPNLRAEAFTGEQVGSQMSDQVTRWMGNPTKGLHLDESTKALTLSRIFLWFEPDFRIAGGVVSFVSRHLGDRSQAAFMEGQTKKRLKLKYFNYSWRLNRTPLAES